MPPSPPPTTEVSVAEVSVIVRTYNSARTLEAALSSVRAQDLPAQIVVVDSGSTDETLDLARAHADVLVEITQAEFTFGGSLNRGAGAAAGRVLVALSSHCTLPRPDWLSLAVAHIDGGAAACCGLPVNGDGEPLHEPFVAELGYLRAHPHWGLSNHASALSAAAWHRHHFDEQLTATEDKEWSWRAVADSGPLVVDPRLIVPGDHRRTAGVRSYYRRLIKEQTALAHLEPLAPYSVRQALRDFASGRTGGGLSGARALGRTRAVEVLARYRAGRMQMTDRPL